MEQDLSATHAGPLLVASDLRQYVYCARIVYYRYCVPVHPPPTFKMVEGQRQHERVEELEHRRSLRAYGLSDGERVFGPHLSSERLGISGTLDMVIVRRHEVAPVEFKHTAVKAPPPRPAHHRRAASPFATGEPEAAEPTERAEEAAPAIDALPIALHHKYQLAAYAMLAEERWQLPARRCFVYFVAARRAAAVAITAGVRDYTRRLLREIRAIVNAQRIPAATRHVGRCVECEFRRFCNDVD